jgi:hypothetical protein
VPGEHRARMGRMPTPNQHEDIGKISDGDTFSHSTIDTPSDITSRLFLLLSVAFLMLILGLVFLVGEHTLGSIQKLLIIYLNGEMR